MDYHNDAVLISLASASFEEQYDHLVTLAARDSPDTPVDYAINEIADQMGSLSFIMRIEAAANYLLLQGKELNAATLREAAVLTVGGDYCESCPMNPQDSTERLRAVKRTILLAARDAPGRAALMHYIQQWELSLTADEVALYLA